MKYIEQIIESIDSPLLSSSRDVLEKNMQNIVERIESLSQSEDFNTEKKFVCLEGSIDYFIFHPSKVNKKTKLLVMLHGCQQDVKDFALITRMNKVAEINNFIVLYPQQRKLHNSYRCWNWFKDNRTGEPIVIKKLIERVKTNLEISKVYIAGLSAGGAMAVILAHDFPDLINGLAVHSGVSYKAASGARDAMRAMKEGKNNKKINPLKVPTLVIHGTDDETVSLINAQEIIKDALTNHPNYIENLSKGVIKGLSYKKVDYKVNDKLVVQSWFIDELGHNWSGGNPIKEYANENGPQASQLIIDFFNEV